MKINYFLVCAFLFSQFGMIVMAQTVDQLMAKRNLPKSRLELSRRSQNGSFYDVVGRKAAAYGYEHRGMEAWVYPMKLVDDFQINFDLNVSQTEVSFINDEGTDVYLIPQLLVAGAESSGLRIIKSEAGENGLNLSLEGLGERHYQLNIKSPYLLQTVEGTRIKQTAADNFELFVSFKGSPEKYVKREILIPYQLPRKF